MILTSSCGRCTCLYQAKLMPLALSVALWPSLARTLSLSIGSFQSLQHQQFPCQHFFSTSLASAVPVRCQKFRAFDPRFPWFCWRSNKYQREIASRFIVSSVIAPRLSRSRRCMHANRSPRSAFAPCIHRPISSANTLSGTQRPFSLAIATSRASSLGDGLDSSAFILFSALLIGTV